MFAYTVDIVITDPAGAAKLTLRAGGGQVTVLGWGDLHAVSSASDRHRYVSAAGTVQDDSNGGGSNTCWYQIEAR